MIQIVIPMAGSGSRFVAAGYKKPKPFIDVLGKTMIERVLDNLHCDGAKFILIARKEHIMQEKETVEKIKAHYNTEFVFVEYLTQGAACTVLLAKPLIDNEKPLVIANSDQIVDICFQDFVDDCFARQLEGSIMTFQDPTKDKKWSFARVNHQELVEEVREKEPISDIATVGIYLFASGSDFVQAAEEMMANNDRVNGEFYVCPTYNYLVRQKRKIGIYAINFQRMHGTGTPQDLETYLRHIQSL